MPNVKIEASSKFLDENFKKKNQNHAVSPTS